MSSYSIAHGACLNDMQQTACLSRALTHRDIEAVFSKTFGAHFNTRLQGDGEEPLYIPADTPAQPHLIIYRHDYPASALHEVAHWCVAGPARRLLPDFGYWYAPDGRSEGQQQEFERVEVKPQALEWIFSVAAGLPFRVSADNLAVGVGPSREFRSAVHRQVLAFCCRGLPDRAARFAAALASSSGCQQPLAPAHYRRDSL